MKRLLMCVLFFGLVPQAISPIELPVLSQEENIPEIRIEDYSFKKRKLSFKILDIRQRKINDKPEGSIKIRVKISDMGDKPLFDQTKSMKTAKKEMNIAIPFYKLKKGKYKVYVEATDLFTNKNAVVKDTVKLKKMNSSVPTDGKFSISYFWRRDNMCRHGISPNIKLYNVPDGTIVFTIKVIDLDMRSSDHGGGIVKYKGKNYIRSGALRNYRGPCPPAGVTHEYSIVVYAINANNKLVGKAEYIQSCSGLQNHY